MKKKTAELCGDIAESRVKTAELSDGAAEIKVKDAELSEDSGEKRKKISSEEIVLRYLKSNDYITTADAQKLTGLTSRGMRSLLKRLYDKGEIQAEGSTKKRRYMIRDK